MHRLALIPLAALVACGGSTTTSGRRDVTTVTVGGAEGGSLRIRNDYEATSAIIGLPIDKVWALLPEAFDTIGVAVTVRDPRQRLFGTDGVKVRQRIGGVPLSRFFDCGTTQVGANADSYEIFLTVMTQLKPAEGDFTTMEVTVTARARPVAFSQGYSDCQDKSTTLNERLFSVVRRLAVR
ncbi:MAG: hypothetical protein OEW77_04020 [Gemmatimonadota bacterium]|nr:hypothetical protein [Gemmatimonadota bacterium]